MSKKKTKQGFLITEKSKNSFQQKIDDLKKKQKNLKVALISHKLSDADALAVCFVFRQYFSSYEIEADIFGSGLLSHPQNKTMASRLQLDIKDKDFFEEHRKQYGLIIFCDTNKKNSSINVQPDIVIDHHSEDELIQSECVVIRKKVGSASTILHFLLKELGVVLEPKAATALAIGISTDTKDLTKEDEVTEFDIQAHKELLSQIDYPFFCQINYRYEITHKFIETMAQGLSHIEFDGYVAVVGLGETTPGQKDSYGIIADLVNRVIETRVVVVIGVENGEAIRASVRTASDLVQADEFCKKLFEVNSATDTGQPSAGARTGSGGAYVPLSNREKGEWAIADNDEKEVLFAVKMRRYKKCIKEILDS